MNKIDFVIAWVDGSDKAWQEEKRKYTPESMTDDRGARYRDLDMLRYWFRAVEAYAPWVNKIHFVTWGHLPTWLNTEHPKLHIVKHSDYIPGEYLPTFSSHPIELNLHRIEDLAEHFVYFNDDMFLAKAVKPDFFFKDGKPCDTCIETAVTQDDYTNPFAHVLLNSSGVLNMHFSKKETIKKNKNIWFSPSYGSAVLRNFLMYPYGQFSSFKFYHCPSPFLKETFRRVWEAEPEILGRISANKFRSSFDVNQYLMKYWQFATGMVSPVSPKRYGYYEMGKEDEKICRAIAGQTVSLFCVDDEKVRDFDSSKTRMKDAFEQAFLKVSSFEK